MDTREKRKELSEHIKFSHFNLKTEDGDGAATVAGVVDKDIFYYGIALCAPEDNFSRPFGRSIAMKRLFFQKEFSGQIVMDKTKTYGENCLAGLLLTLYKHMKDRDEYDWPSWYTSISSKHISFRTKKKRKP